MVETRSMTMKRKQKEKDSASVNCAKVAKCETSNEQVETETETNQNDNVTRKGLNPLQMEDTLSHLFKFLDLNALKNSRSVCQLWNVEITKMFFKNRVVKVPTNFHAKYGPNKELNNFQNFFSSVGKIQCLKFNDHRDTQIFIRLCVPWEKIEVIISSIDQVEMEEEVNSKAFEELLKMAHRVKQIQVPFTLLSYQNPCVKLLDLILSAAERREKEGKFPHPILISGLNLKITSRQDLYQLKKLSQSTMIQFQDVAFDRILDIARNPGIEFEVSEMLEKILEKNKNTLVQLFLDKYFGTLAPKFQMSVMPHLQTFGLQCIPIRAQPEQNQHVQFPPDFQFHKNMPNLQSVTLVFGRDTNDESFWNNIFDNMEPAPSVKMVILATASTSSSYLQLFPNKIFDTFSSVETLVISQNVFVDLFHVGQSCSQLKSLSYELPKDESESKLLVSRISGCPLEIIEMGLNSIDVEYIEDLRTSSSLLDLPGLKELDFYGSNQNFLMFQKYLPMVQELILRHLLNNVEVELRVFDDKLIG